jgi:hypothetical protein
MATHAGRHLHVDDRQAAIRLNAVRQSDSRQVSLIKSEGYEATFFKFGIAQGAVVFLVAFAIEGVLYTATAGMNVVAAVLALVLLKPLRFRNEAP